MAKLMSNYLTSIIPFYLVYVIEFGNFVEDLTKTPWELALVPLVMYIASALTSFLLPKIQGFERKSLYFLGCMLVCVCMLFMTFLGPSNKYWVIPLIFMAGSGFSLCLNTSMGLISAFVGQDARSGAVVWGMLGLF